MIALTLLLACAESAPPPLAASPALAVEAVDEQPAEPAATTIREGAERAGLDWPPPEISVHIDKSERILAVRSGDSELVRWPVGLGGSPSGDKVRQGDQRTPVGTFRIVTRNPQSAYHLFLGISYPDREDAARGLEAGWLTDAQAESIESADRSGTKPPWGTTLGGAIGIHGGGSGADWTLGCIALDNVHIEELWELAPHGTAVIIRE